MSLEYKEKQSIIEQNIPLLIQSLTGFQESDPNYKLCIDYAKARIANHRYLSVNGHEIKRRINGLSERFMAANRSHFSKVLTELVDTLINDPLCLAHHEVDIHWSILQFLLDISKDPVGALPKGEYQMPPIIDAADVESLNDSMMDELMASLAACNNSSVDVPKLRVASDSDLSDWSDTERSSNHSDQVAEPPKSTDNRVIASGSTIRPPERQPTYVESTNEYSFDHVQPNWWLSNGSDESGETAAEEFSEWIAMREIIWMFRYDPAYMIGRADQCGFKFFAIDATNESVSINANAKVLGDRTRGLMLKAFTDTFTILYRLRSVQNAIGQRTAKLDECRAAPTTIQVYANALKDFDKTVIDLATSLEQRLIQQHLDDQLTLVWLFNQFLPQMHIMNLLYSIHSKVYVDYSENPGYMCATQLLANLMNEMDATSSIVELHILASVFLTVIRHYLIIFDIWWSEGEINDWHAEFVVVKRQSEHLSANSYRLQPKLERGIDSSPIVRLLCDAAMETGFAIGTLHDLNKINAIKWDQRCAGAYNTSMVGVFYEKVWAKIQALQIATGADMAVSNGCAGKIDDCWTTYQRLQSNDGLPLHFNEIFLECIEETLKPRISLANKFTFETFLIEYKIREHFNSVRDVFLFGAGDVLQTFYSQVFEKMKFGEKWNNPYLLTVQLDTVLATKYMDSSIRTLFSIQTEAAITDQSKQPLEAINGIRINYAICDIARQVFTAECFDRYNSIFRFILKIKWTLWTLEGMRFPLVFRRPAARGAQATHSICKRLAMIRNWMFYSIQSIHSHLMISVIQSMSEKFAKKLKRVECLRHLTELHGSYVKVIHRYCFQNACDADLREGINQICQLAAVLANEWSSICAMETDQNLQVVDENLHRMTKSIYVIESTYAKCHTYIAKKLSKEVYVNNRDELAPLSTAFNCSCPY